MAAVASETVNILVNDIELTVPKGELIVESVKRLGLEIPIFCYHPRMKAVGMCRMCLVEVGFKGQDGTVKKMPKPQAACTLPASEGMAIYTDSEMVHKDRRGVLELLLINHPLDCPICDRGGECPLQNNTLFYGPSTSRFVELKRHLPKAFPLSKYVTLDLERCIQCGRCVRFTEEISGDSQLAFRFRGASMQPSTFEMTNFESKFSGNVIEICPVGALTSAEYRFRARPWDLETKPAVCTVCSNGCNIWFDYRVGKMVRINGRTNDAVNEEWTCDRGKFGHEFYNSEKRLSRPLIRREDRLEECDWSEIYSSVLEHFAVGGQSVAALGGMNNSNEDLYILQKLFREQFGSNNLDHRFTKTLQTKDGCVTWHSSSDSSDAVLPQTAPSAGGVGERSEPGDGSRSRSSSFTATGGTGYLTPDTRNQVPTPIASLEHQKSILLFGTSLADEEPILFLRVRKGWFKHGTKVVVAHHAPTDADSFADIVLRYKPGTESVLALGLLKAAGSNDPALASFTADQVAKQTGVDANSISAASALLASSAAPVITTRSLLNTPSAGDSVKVLTALGNRTGGGFNLYALRCNEQGAESLGILPDMLPGLQPAAPSGLNTHQILQGCVDGTIKALWIVDCDPLELHPDRALVEQALENVEFLVYQGILEREVMEFASVVLPMAAPAEMDGTYTNVEGRVQRIRPIIGAKGQAKEAWRAYQEIMLRSGLTKPFFNSAEIMTEVASKVSWLSDSVYHSPEEEPGSP